MFGGRTTTVSATRIPGFIDHVVNKRPRSFRVYLPPDANCLLAGVTDHRLRSRNYVNVVVAGKAARAAVAHHGPGGEAPRGGPGDLGVGEQ